MAVPPKDSRTVFYSKVLSILGSTKTFYIIVGVFILQSSWIALSGIYPMAFDESFHFGLIQLHAYQLLPFFTHEPAGASIYGAVSRDPSYLYHYLMSFPYRLIQTFTGDTTIQVIILRFLNVFLFVVGLIIFRKLLLRMQVSKSMTHLVLLFFTLVPITSFLAAQINYDNLLIPLVGMSILLELEFLDRLRKKNIFLIQQLSILVIVCLLTSIVMYSFLPIFIIEMGFMGFIVIRKYWKKYDQFSQQLHLAFKLLSNVTKISLLLGLLISGGLFMERYGYNIWKYHTPLPDCSKVLTAGECQNYSPWERNYLILQSKATFPHPTTYQYTRNWLHTLIYSMFFAINGANSGFFAQPPLPLPEWTAVCVAIIGLFLLVLYRKKLLYENSANQLLAVIAGFYMIVLWADNYSDYLHYGYPVAIQGRYLLSILIPIFILVGLAFRELLRHRYLLKPVIACLVLILFLDGGGVLTFIVRNDPSWYWNVPTIIHLNQTVQKSLKPFILGSNI